MKKSMRFLPMVAMLAVLASCNNMPKEGGSVPKGKEISVKEAKAQMVVAEQAMEDDDSIGLSMDKASMHYDFAVEQSYPTGQNTNGAINFETHAHIDDASFNAGVKGLTSKKVEDLKGSLSSKAKFDVGGSLSIGDTKSSYKAPSGSYGFDAYLDNNSVYLDLSDTKLQSMFDVVQKENSEYKSLANGNADVALASKAMFNLGLEDENLPITSKENLDAFTKNVSEKIEDIASKGGTIKAMDHGNGTYSYSVETKDLNNAYDFMDEIQFTSAFQYEKQDNNEEQKDGETTTTSILNTNHTIKRSFKVNNYSIAYIFNEKGISSIGTTIDVGYSYENKFDLNGYSFGTKVTMNYTLNGRINFNVGEDVKIAEVQDKDSYKVTDEDINSIVAAVDEIC